MAIILLLIGLRVPTAHIILAALLALLLSTTIPAVFILFSWSIWNLTEVLGAVVSRMLLTLVFFLVVTPIAFLRRMAHIDPFGRNRWKNGSGSVFCVRNQTFYAENLKRPF